MRTRIGFPFILLGILRMKRMKKNEKERGLVSSLHPLNSLPLVVVAFAKKSYVKNIFGFSPADEPAT